MALGRSPSSSTSSITSSSFERRTVPRRTLPLVPQTVADFYREVMDMLRDMGLPVAIWPMPVEVPTPIRFEERSPSTIVRSGLRATGFWRSWPAARTCSTTRGAFRRQVQPGPFFLGRLRPGGDAILGAAGAATRGPRVHARGVSHEVISHGFWPGSGPLLEAAYYAYAVPEPRRLQGGARANRLVPITTASSASSSFRTTRSARRPIPMARFGCSSTAPTVRPPISRDGNVMRSSVRWLLDRNA